MLDQATLDAGAAEAHRLGMLTVAHALTIEATRMSIDAGIDGLVHLFMDRPHTPEIVDAIAQSGAFAVGCVTPSTRSQTIALIPEPRRRCVGAFHPRHR